MDKIITITFSPCIDKSAAIPELAPEKKLRCSDPKLEPGGGGINVARAIHKLGGEAIAIFPSGGYTGKFFNHLMEKEQVPSVIIECKNETRENIIILDESSNKQYRFGMPGTELSQQEWESCLKAVEEQEAAYIVASGSLPPGVPLDIYARLSVIAKKKKAKLIVDTSGEALKHAVDEGVFMIKPNLGELAGLAGLEHAEEDQLENIVRKVLSETSCEWVALSMGKKGAMLISANKSYQAKAPPVESKSTVGAGDSMLAGIVLSIAENRDFGYALQYAVAAGSAATINPGTELCNKKDTDKLFDIIRKS